MTNDIAKMADLIKGIDIAMLITEDDGKLRGRPMGVQQVEFDGDLWFFTQRSSPKVGEIEVERQVNVSFAHPGKQTYVSVSGTATMVDDRAKMVELWRDSYKMFFPKGLDDPEITLLKVDVQEAEFWDAPSGLMVTLIGLFSRDHWHGAKLGEHEKIELL